MFGQNGEQMEHLVKKHQWDKIGKKLHNANIQTKTALAAACGNSSDDEASNILINLLRDSDEAVQLQAIKSLGATGNNSSKTHLQWLSNNLPDEKKEIKEAITEALSQISARKK